MKKKFWRIIIIVISCGVVFYGGVWHMSLSPVYAQIESPGFLHPPYYGAASVNTVFDHEFPVYTNEADEDYVDCANNPDPNVITTTVFHYDGVRFQSDALPYSGHDGIDFGLNHDYVLAAHDGTVTEARWMDSQNRRAGLGLFIELRTADQIYRTQYGHMSTLMVKKDDTVNQQQVIGISGNTGDSTGPHLHFTVSANGVKVNPYGWVGTVTDPWHCVHTNTPSQPLWEILPALTNNVYPSGPGLPFPLEPKPPLTPDYSHPARLTIDDTDGSRFYTYFGSPWKQRTCANFPDPDDYDFCFSSFFPGGTAYHYYGSAAHEYAGWEVLKEDLLGYYDVYAYIPSKYSSSTLAYYEIRHSNQILWAGIDQSRFHTRSGDNPWTYLGRYNFSQPIQHPSQNKQWVRVHHIPNPRDPHEITTVPLNLRFYAHYNPNSPTFSNSNRPEHRTPLTTEWVSWNMDNSTADRWFSHTRRVSPDLAPIVQEMVNHPNWTQGQSALTFIVKPAPNFSGNDHRRVMAYERQQPPPGQYSARLLVWYEE
jgi:hypothetical protein